LADIVIKYGRHPEDTGSSIVQVCIMTEHLRQYKRHSIDHSRDIRSKYGFDAMLHRRRKLLKYMKRNEYPDYKRIMTDLGLSEEVMASVGREAGRKVRGFFGTHQTNRG